MTVCLGPGRTRRPSTDLATLGAVALSGWGAVHGFLFGQLVPSVCYENNYRLEGPCHFIPEFSPLWCPFTEPPTALTGIQKFAVAFYAVAPLWLAVPLVGRIVRQVGATARVHPWLLCWSGWRW